MTTKKILSVLICLVMVLSLMPMAAFATEGGGGTEEKLSVKLLKDRPTYSGTSQEPQISVSYGENALQSTDYTVSYTRNGAATTDFTSRGVITVTVTYNGSTASVDYTIVGKDMTIAVDNKEKAYGDNDPELTGTVTGLQSGDSVVYSRISGEDVSTYTISAKIMRGGLDVSGNYNITSNTTGTLTIKAKDVADPNVVLEYDSAEYTGSPLTPSVTVKDGEAVISDDEYSVTYENNTNVGKGKVIISDNNTNGNYNITSKTVEFDITQASTTPPAAATNPPLKITVNNQTITYGENISSDFGEDYTYEGLAVGHTAQITLGLNGSLIVVSDAKIFAGSDDVTSQYDVTYKPGSLTVTPATLTVTAKDASKELGAEDPALEYTVTGLVNGDTVADVLTGALAREQGDTKGVYEITQGNLAIKADKQANYQLSFIPGKFTIGGEALTITAGDQSITYGSAIDKTKYSVTSGSLPTNAVLTVTLTPSISTVGTGSIAVSNAVIKDAGGTDITANYAISYVSGALTITPKTVDTPTIKLERTSYGYTGKAVTPTVTAVYDGSTLIPATEYTVSYENNVNLGTGTVKIVDKDGGNYTVSGYTTFSIVNNVGYKVVMGNGGCWYRGSYYGLGFRCDGPYADFLGITIDGQPVDKSYYVASEGSTNVGLYPQLLSMLGNGTHYITFKYTSGSATGVFYVGSTAINAVMTGDDSNVGLLALVMCLGLLSSIATLGVLRKKKSGAR
ncbi:MAG: hypothetical protein IJZ91_01165 [Oscillospiraceae bacterium]|nr:hypothetical protein [Oscillospiraceae bacterium]